MSLINSANPGSQIDLMCIIFRVLRRSGGTLPANELLEFCRPETLSENDDQKKRVPGELRFWAHRDHQLWKLDSNERYRLVSYNSSDTPDPGEIASVVADVFFSTRMESVLQSERQWDGVDQLMAMLSCVLAAPELASVTVTTLTKDSLRELLAKYLPASSRLNDSELPVALEYAHFLGFLETSDTDGYVVDPSAVVLRALRRLLQPGDSMALDECVSEFAKKVPVLDGGSFRSQVESVMKESGFVPNPSGKLSRSLSHALYRLRLGGMIKIDEMSDDRRAVTLSLPVGERKYSRIHLLDPRS